MEHGVTWLSFLPGYQQLELYWQSAERGMYNHGVFGHPVILQHVVAALLVSLVLLLIAWRSGGELRQAGENAVVPPPQVSLRNLVELICEALYGQMKVIIGPGCERYFPVLATFSLFILMSNLLGLIPGFSPPTDNWNTTFACSLFIFLYFNFHGLRSNGIGHIVHMANPIGTWWGWFFMPLLFPIELVSMCTRPVSLGVRLATNMMGDHAVLMAFLGLVPIIVPLPFMVLGLMVSVVQTLVFVLLSMVYLALATADAHGDHDGDHGKAAAHA